MAHNIYLIALAALALFVAAKKLRAYIEAQKFIKEHGCKPPHRLPQRDRFIGYGLYRTQKKAAVEKKLLQTSLNRFKENGPTWSGTIMGNTFFNTTDPENIKAILATNFNDFGLGMRLDTFGDLLGRGIFTSDGPHWEFSRVSIATGSPKKMLIRVHSHWFAQISLELKWPTSILSSVTSGI